MPIVTIQAITDVLTPDRERELIGAVTDAVAGTLGDAMRPYVTVLIQPVARERWGVGGVTVPAT